jgi:phospholipid N-methyltransferase
MEQAENVQLLSRSRSTFLFVRQFFESPLQVGSIVPSSRYLTECMLEGIEADDVKVYVEYGPGTGRFTEQALSQFDTLNRMVLLEINPAFQALLQQNFHLAEIYSHPKEILDELRNKVDLIVSGLPFTNIPWSVTRETIDASFDLLVAGGTFRSFLYIHTFFLPKNKRLYTYLISKFARVKLRFVARNFPPAFVIEGRK